MFDLHEYVTGPEKLIQTYNEFFNGIIAKGLHGTLLIPPSPVRGENELDEHSNGCFVTLSDVDYDRMMLLNDAIYDFDLKIRTNLDKYSVLCPSLSITLPEFHREKGVIVISF